MPYDGDGPTGPKRSITGNWAVWRGTSYDPKAHMSADQRDRAGRQADILYEGRTFPVTSNYSPEASRKARQAQHDGAVKRLQEGTGRTLQDDEHGKRVRTDPGTTVMERVCAGCGQTFHQSRPASQRRKWRAVCSDVCRETVRRRSAIERAKGA